MKCFVTLEGKCGPLVLYPVDVQWLHAFLSSPVRLCFELNRATYEGTTPDLQSARLLATTLLPAACAACPFGWLPTSSHAAFLALQSLPCAQRRKEACYSLHCLAGGTARRRRPPARSAVSLSSASLADLAPLLGPQVVQSAVSLALQAQPGEAPTPSAGRTGRAAGPCLSSSSSGGSRRRGTDMLCTNAAAPGWPSLLRLLPGCCMLQLEWLAAAATVLQLSTAHCDLQALRHVCCAAPAPWLSQRCRRSWPPNPRWPASQPGRHPTQSSSQAWRWKQRQQIERLTLTRTWPQSAKVEKELVYTPLCKK